MGFPGGSVVQESAYQCRRHRLDPWVKKIPWRRKWQPTPIFLPREFHRQRTWWGTVHRSHKDFDTTEHWAQETSTTSSRPHPMLEQKPIHKQNKVKCINKDPASYNCSFSQFTSLSLSPIFMCRRKAGGNESLQEEFCLVILLI